MKLDVPFYKQESKMDCGPTALMMALAFLGKPYSKDRIFDLVDSDRSGVTWTLGLAKAAAQLGFDTEFYTTSLGFNPENYKLDFYKKNADSASSTEQKLERLRKEALKFDVKMQEKSLTLEDILSKISKDCIAIVLLNWAKVVGKGKYRGHFVPIVGYDSRNVYVHNQGLKKSRNFMPIKRDFFDSARKAAGTDEDIVFIHRK